jgi:hypothetical protein
MLFFVGMLSFIFGKVSPVMKRLQGRYNVLPGCANSLLSDRAGLPIRQGTGKFSRVVGSPHGRTATTAATTTSLHIPPSDGPNISTIGQRPDAQRAARLLAPSLLILLFGSSDAGSPCPTAVPFFGTIHPLAVHRRPNVGPSHHPVAATIVNRVAIRHGSRPKT